MTDVTTTNTNRRPRILIIAGEASGDLHGANLIRAARELSPGLSFFGVGGPKMRSEGCETLVDAEELAVMGLTEIIGRYATIRRAFRLLETTLTEQRPDLVVLIDYAGFNLRFARSAKRHGIPVLYYIAPKVWAWRAGRIKKIGFYVDRLAAIFPFEPELYKDEPVKVDYVGNPLLDDFEQKEGRESFLSRYGLDLDRPVIGLFPGSRNSELKYIFSTVVQTAEKLLESDSQLQFILPVAPTLSRTDILSRLGSLAEKVTLVEDDIYATAVACDAILCVSGTITLQVALTGTPMAVIYRASPLTYQIMRHLVRIDFFSLVNIVAGREVVREFLQDAAEPETLSREIFSLINDQDYRSRVVSGLSEVRDRLGNPGCSVNVVKIILEMLADNIGSTPVEKK